MVNVIKSHGGYADEKLFNNWFRYNSYTDWGILEVNTKELIFDGNKGNMVIPKEYVKDATLVHKKIGPLIYFILLISFLILISPFFTKSKEALIYYIILPVILIIIYLLKLFLYNLGQNHFFF